MDFHKFTVVLLMWALLFSGHVLAKPRYAISDNEIRAKKSRCYEDIESGLLGGLCMSSRIAKENCALRCLSPSCYELIYESDPLEEGEKDYVRGQEFKYCMHSVYSAVGMMVKRLLLVVGRIHVDILVSSPLNRQSLGESLEGIRGSFE